MYPHSHIHTYTLMYPSVSYDIQALLYTLPQLRIPLIYSPIHPWCLLPLTTCPRVSVPRASLRDSPDQGTLTCHCSSANTRIQRIPSPNDRPISPLQIRSLQLLLTPLGSRDTGPQTWSVHRPSLQTSLLWGIVTCDTSIRFTCLTLILVARLSIFNLLTEYLSWIGLPVKISVSENCPSNLYAENLF
jgi:hypothetical protein